MQEVRFKLQLTAEQYQNYYAGRVKFVQVQSYDGRTVRFPANQLQTFLTHDGIEGEFILQFDEMNKFVALKKL